MINANIYVSYVPFSVPPCILVVVGLPVVVVDSNTATHICE